MPSLLILLLFILFLVVVLFINNKSNNKFASRKKIKTAESKNQFRKRKPEWVVKEIVKLKAYLSDYGCRKIADTFNQRFEHKMEVTVSKTYVHKIIKRHNYEILKYRKDIKSKPPYQYIPKKYWGMDLTFTQNSRKEQTTILGIVEFHSRACLSLQHLKDKSTLSILSVIINTCKKYGKPKIIRTDNEHVFTSRLFKACLWFLGIRHQTTEIASPWMNGRIERLFGTLKGKLRQARSLENITTEKLLSDFRFYYNFCRPHQHLKGYTPAEAWSDKSQRETKRKKAYWYEGWGGELRGIFIPPD